METQSKHETADKHLSETRKQLALRHGIEVAEAPIPLSPENIKHLKEVIDRIEKSPSQPEEGSSWALPVMRASIETPYDDLLKLYGRKPMAPGESVDLLLDVPKDQHDSIQRAGALGSVIDYRIGYVKSRIQDALDIEDGSLEQSMQHTEYEAYPSAHHGGMAALAMKSKLEGGDSIVQIFVFNANQEIIDNQATFVKGAPQ